MHLRLYEVGCSPPHQQHEYGGRGRGEGEGVRRGTQRMSTSRIKADPTFPRKLLAYLFRFVLTSKFRSSQSYFQNIQNVCNYFITISFYTYFITISLRSRTAPSSLQHFWEIEFSLFILMLFLWQRIPETVRMANMAYTRISVRFQLHICVIDLFTVSRDWWTVFTFILKYDNKYTCRWHSEPFTSLHPALFSDGQDI